MTTTETKWLRVNRERPCPVCGHADWCLVADDGGAAICPRTESPKRCGNAGYLHKLNDEPRQLAPRRVVVIPSPTAPPDLTALAERYQNAAMPDQLHGFAKSLGLETRSVIAFGVGWAAEYRAWSFPMKSPATGNVTGIRLRPLVGRKFSVRGGKEALFTPDTLTADAELLLITEGATDALAAHSLGFPNVAGRPSCTGGTSHIVALLREQQKMRAERGERPPRVVIARDNDEPGIRGAEALASALALHSRDVRVIAPPDGAKDLREWAAAGATRADVERIIAGADARRLNLTFKAKEMK